MNIITCALLLPCIITVATASAADGVDASAAPRPARRAPDFIVIGAVKAGTSAFRTAGRRHPTVDVISVDASYFYETQRGAASDALLSPARPAAPPAQFFQLERVVSDDVVQGARLVRIPVRGLPAVPRRRREEPRLPLRPRGGRSHPRRVPERHAGRLRPRTRGPPRLARDPWVPDSRPRAGLARVLALEHGAPHERMSPTRSAESRGVGRTVRRAGGVRVLRIGALPPELEAICRPRHARARLRLRGTSLAAARD